MLPVPLIVLRRAPPWLVRPPPVEGQGRARLPLPGARALPHLRAPRDVSAGLRVAWLWKVDMGEEVLERFAKGPPAGRCAPGGTLPLPSAVGRLPMVSTLDHQSVTVYVTVYAVAAGVVPTLVLVFLTLPPRAVRPPTKGELVKALGTFRKPRREYAITPMLPPR